MPSLPPVGIGGGADTGPLLERGPDAAEGRNGPRVRDAAAATNWAGKRRVVGVMLCCAFVMGASASTLLAWIAQRLDMATAISSMSGVYVAAVRSNVHAE